MKRILAVLLFASCAFAQDCPVQVKEVFPHWGNHLYGNVFEELLRVHWKNTTNKKITGVKFNAVYFDQLGDAHAIPEDFNTDSGAKPGQTKIDNWNVDVWVYQYGKKSKATVEVKKVAFEDGSTWEPSEDGQCSARSK